MAARHSGLILQPCPNALPPASRGSAAASTAHRESDSPSTSKAWPAGQNGPDIHHRVVSGVVGITDIIARSLTGLVTLQALYKSADMLVAVIIGYLHTVKHALEEIKVWVENIEDRVEYASILAKIEHAVQCFGVPLGTLLETIEGLQRHADAGTLTPKGKLSFMLGQEETEMMSIHLGNQVQAVNLLMTMAQCNTRQERKEILEDEETRSVFKQIQDDSSSYMEGDAFSLHTLKSGATEQTDLLDSTFGFDQACFDSTVYRNAFRTMVEEQRGRRADATGNPRDTSSHQADSRALTIRAESKDALNRPNSRGSMETVRHTGQLMKQAGPSTVLAIPAKHDETHNGSVRMAAQKFSDATSNQYSTADTHQRTAQAHKNTLKSVSYQQGLLTRLFLSPESRSRRAAQRREEEYARKRNEYIEQQLRSEHLNKRNEIKTLLLGAHDSGKSTWMKQLKLIHEGSYTLVERENFKMIIFTDVCQSMRAVLVAMATLELRLAGHEPESHARTIFMQPKIICSLPTNVGLAIRALCNDPGVQETIARSREYQLYSCAQYFFDCIDRISQADYLPSDKDILYARDRTTSIFETRFNIGELTYRVYDVGGTRSERKKWIYVFEKVTTVLFFVDISGYDQRLFEDENVYRMQEDLMLLESICYVPLFAKTTLVLFLKKIDLFKTKLSKSPTKTYFPGYEGGDNYGSACDYILNRFVSLNRHETKQIYTHFTCALDTTQTRFVIAAVHDIIVQENLRDCGLV